jgi:hypothetical protein
VSTNTDASTRDWLRSPTTSLLAWWGPQTAIVAGLLASVPVRAAVWTFALIWMGVACILNARCGRTHCRCTGPFYLAMIAPVFLLAAGIGSVGFLGWLLLGVLILAGKQNHLVGPRPQITTPHDGSRGRIQRLAARPATSLRAGYRPKSWRHMPQTGLCFGAFETGERSTQCRPKTALIGGSRSAAALLKWRRA